MPRLFTGLEVPAETGFALSLKRGGPSSVRWIDAENYHITLRFIGDVDNRCANEIAAGLDMLANGPAFDIGLSHLGVFGGEKPRSLYAGVDPNASLLGLQVAQERLLQRIGLPAEGRKFMLHVTLARLRGVSAWDMAGYIATVGQLPPLSFPISRFVLFSSRDFVGGGPYAIEETYPLVA